MAYYHSQGAAKRLMRRLNLERKIKNLQVIMRSCSSEERRDYQEQIDKYRQELQQCPQV